MQPHIPDRAEGTPIDGSVPRDTWYLLMHFVVSITNAYGIVHWTKTIGHRPQRRTEIAQECRAVEKVLLRLKMADYSESATPRVRRFPRAGTRPATFRQVAFRSRKAGEPARSLFITCMWVFSWITRSRL